MSAEGADDKRATPGVSLPFGSSEGWIGEWIVAQIRDHGRLARPSWIHLVAFPPAEGHGTNFQPASCFGLEDFQLEPASSEIAANRGRSLWNWNATVVGW